MAIRVPCGAKHRPSPGGGRKENGLPHRLWLLAMTVVGEGWSYYFDMVFTEGNGRFLNRPYAWSHCAAQTENPLSRWLWGCSVCQRTPNLAPRIYEGGCPKGGGSPNICAANIRKCPLFAEKWTSPPTRRLRALPESTGPPEGELPVGQERPPWGALLRGGLGGFGVPCGTESGTFRKL